MVKKVEKYKNEGSPNFQLKVRGDIVTAAIAHLAHNTPTNFLFSSTNFNRYVTQSIADDAPQRQNGCLSINQSPGLGHPYFTCDSNESVNFFTSQKLQTS